MFDFNKDTKNIGGWLTKAEGIFLFNISQKIKSENIIIEIGSWKGKSTICLGNGSKNGNKSKIFAIDPHTGSSEHKKIFNKVDTFNNFKENIKKAGINNLIYPIRETSQSAVKYFNKNIGLYF